MSLERADSVAEESLWLRLKFRDRVGAEGYEAARRQMREDCGETKHFQNASGEMLDNMVAYWKHAHDNRKKHNDRVGTGNCRA